MREGRGRRATVLLLTSVVLGCASSDLGTPCHLLRADGTELSPMAGHDVVQSGSGECEQLACVAFNGAAPRCSRPCMAEGDACDAGWVCRALVLDPSMLAELRTRTEGRDDDYDGVDDFQQLAAGLTDSLYCGPAS